MNLYILQRVIYFVVCFMQPIAMPIPEPVTVMAGSATFGAVQAALIGFLGTTLGIITMFFIGRLASDKFIKKIVNEKLLSKFNEYRSKHENSVLLFLFILPILPDEIICIGAGLAKINPYKFIIIATISKAITSVSLAFSLEIFNISFSKIIIILIFILCCLVLKRLISKYTSKNHNKIY